MAGESADTHEAEINGKKVSIKTLKPYVQSKVRSSVAHSRKLSLQHLG